MIKIWANNSFTGYYPVGVAAVICAETAEKAAIHLNDELKSRGLPGDAEAADMIDLTKMESGDYILLNDGEY